MTSTRAVYVNAPGGLNHIQLGTADTPAPTSGQVTVRVQASSLNYHDYAIVAGKTKLGADRRIPMADASGEVVAVGDGVTDFVAGDHVVSTFFPGWLEGPPRLAGFATTPGDGLDGYARDTVTAHVNAFTHAPKGYSHAEAATLTTAGVTAWRALFVDGAMKPGATVLVQGTGGVSIFALQLAKAAGATVIATSSSDSKIERLTALGADHVINYKTNAQWGLAAAEIARGGVDHVIDVGGAGTLDQSMQAARAGGHISVIGILGGISGNLMVAQILRKQLRLTGLLVGSRRDQLDLVRALETNGVRPVLDRSFALESMADAFRFQESNQHFGKITLAY